MQGRLGSSELILNDDGSIYHLNLKQGEVGDTVITVGDPGRVPVVTKHFDHIELKREKREFISHTGTFNGKRITVTSSGIGTDNIDIVINELDAVVNLDFEKRTLKDTHKSLNIFRLGTSGALYDHIPVDSLVISKYGLGLDNLAHFYSSSESEHENELLKTINEQTGLHSTIPGAYIRQGSVELETMFDDSFVRGITVTAPGFYGPQGRVLRAPLAFPHMIEKSLQTIADIS